MITNNAKGGTPAWPDGYNSNTAHGLKRGVNPVALQPRLFTWGKPLSSSSRKVAVSVFYSALVAVMIFVIIVMTMIGIGEQPQKDTALMDRNDLPRKEISWR